MSVEFFGALTGEPLRAGCSGVSNCSVPKNTSRRDAVVALVGRTIAEQGCELLLVRDVPVDHGVAVITQFGIVGEDVRTAREHLTESLPDA